MPATLRPTRALVLLLLLVVVPLATPAAGALRERLRERIAERSAPPAVPAIRLAPGQRITVPGRYEIRLRHDGIERLALVHVPRAYLAGAPAALIMALHGGGGSAAFMADEAAYGLISKSEQAGFIVVFPNGITRARNGMLATWNAGTCCAMARDENVDDVGFLRAVLADVSRRADVQPERVYAIGMSNGAMMAYRLACEAGDVFRGIMAVAGTDNTTRCAPQHPVPILHVHARDDDRVLFQGGAGEKFRRADLVADFVSVPRTIERWVALNNAEPMARPVLTVPGANCELHAGRAGGAPVQLCTTDSGGHSWPGGKKGRGNAVPSQAIRANDVMWDFFARLPS